MDSDLHSDMGCGAEGHSPKGTVAGVDVGLARGRSGWEGAGAVGASVGGTGRRSGSRQHDEVDEEQGGCGRGVWGGIRGME